MAKPSAITPPEPSLEPASPAPSTDPLDPLALAEGVLARTIRPKAADIRRLAEAVVAAAGKPDKKKKKKGDKKTGGKKRKLSKIPGQKGAK